MAKPEYRCSLPHEKKLKIDSVAKVYRLPKSKAALEMMIDVAYNVLVNQPNQ